MSLQMETDGGGHGGDLRGRAALFQPEEDIDLAELEAVARSSTCKLSTGRSPNDLRRSCPTTTLHSSP